MLKYAAGLAVLGCLTAIPAFAGPEDIKFPKNYETEMLNYLSLDRGNGKQTARIFADRASVTGVQKNGEFPDGSVVVMEVSKVKMGADGKPVKSALGRFINDGKQVILVMQKIKGTDSDLPEELRNGDWEFAAFSPAGKFIAQDYNKCRACHAPLKEARHLFSYDHLEKANLADYLIKTSAAYQPVDNNRAVAKILNSLSLPKELEKQQKARKDRDGPLVDRVLGSISVPEEKRPVAAGARKSAKDLLASISLPEQNRTGSTGDKKKVADLLASISIPGIKKPADRDNGNDARFRQNLAIKKVILRQLDAFRNNNSSDAFEVAAPAIRTTFNNSGNFMRMVKSSYPVVFFSKKAVFPPMIEIRGSQHIQKVVLEDPRGKLVVARYSMVKIGGRWKIAGCSITGS